MDLTTKTKLDLIDAHLWAEAARFTVSCRIDMIPNFFPLLCDIKMIVHPHGEDSDSPEYYVNLEFIPVTVRNGRIQAKLAKLIEMAYVNAGAIQISFDETSARLDASGNVIESWTNERTY